MEPITPYLHFNGNAEEALAFYKNVFGGEVIFRQTYGESPLESPKEWKDKLMHAVFQAGSLTLMVSDVRHPEVVSGTNTSLSLNFKHEDDLSHIFALISEGGQITFPLQDTFWGAKFGMLTDQFGINWMFNLEKAKPDA